MTESVTVDVPQEAQPPAESSSPTDQTSTGFTADERAALRERAAEVTAAKKRGRRASKADEEGAVLAKIAEMPEPDRVLAERLYAVITASGPELSPRLWYGMPAYAKDGKIICFFQSAYKFGARYATLRFDARTNLDEGTMWPTAFALTQLTAADEERIGALVARAVS